MSRRWAVSLVVGLIAIGVAHVAMGLGYLGYSMAWWGDLPYTADFEDGDLREFGRFGAKQLCCSHSATVVGTPVRDGSRALQITLRSDDPLVKGSKRAELRHWAVGFHQTFVYEFSVFLPEDWLVDDDATILAQWHGVADRLLGEKGTGRPALLMTLRGRQLVVETGQDSDWVTWGLTSSVNRSSSRHHWTGDARFGEWQDFVLAVQWSPDDDGKLKIWRDHEFLVDYDGPISTRDLIGPYLKLGVYVPGWKLDKDGPLRSRTAFFDRVSIRRADWPTGAEPP